MKLKFNGNQYVKIGSWKRLTSWCGRSIKKTIIYALMLNLAAWGAYGLVMYGRMTAEPKIVSAKETIEVPVLNAPVLARIAQCESGGNQFGKDGQVQMHVNADKTVDTGKYMINSVWRKQATKLGYDLTKESDNEAFAQYLYLNYGTGPWYSSSKCWSK